MSKKTNKNNIEQESGRSMVEMLGVLAIIGVLSVGGISGYTTAMNKHKANEILNAAAVRAMAVSSQLQSGTPIGSVSLGEFTNENEVGGATFGNVTDAGNNRFTIGFSMDNEAVLKQMQNIAGTDGIVRDLTGTGITYNNDLTTDKIASDYKTQDDCKTPYTWCAALKTCQNAGETCECPDNSSTTTTTEGPITGTACYCNSGYKLEGNECKSAGTKYKQGGSEPMTHTAITAINGGCPDGYHWATYNEVKDLSFEEISSIPREQDICDNCSSEAYWLKDCTDSTCSSEAWALYSAGMIWGATRNFELNNFYTLCIKNS